MGSVVFGAPRELVLSLAAKHRADCFVETGTFRGGTAAWAAWHFRRVITIELSRQLYRRARRRLWYRWNVRQMLGPSEQHLAALAPTLGRCIFWLDAHWCGGMSEGKDAPCSILGEIEAIAPFWGSSVVLVDDARLFGKQEGWPSLEAVIAALSTPGRRVWQQNDVIVSAPES